MVGYCSDCEASYNNRNACELRESLSQTFQKLLSKKRKEKLAKLLSQ